jgi:hypothetical protein
MIAGGWIIELDIRKYFELIDHERRARFCAVGCAME